MLMHHVEDTFAGWGGLYLYCQYWHPEAPTRAVLVVVPGIGGHSGIYGRLIECLLPQNYSIYSFDLRGNGRSPGQRAFIHSWVEFREDLRAFLHWVRSREPNLPIFLMGHSVGGVVALDYCLKYPEEAADLRGVIAFSPALGRIGVSPLKILLGQLLSWIYPRFSLHTRIAPETASRDPAIIAANMQDPLRHDLATARLATELFGRVDWIQAHAADWRLPLLLQHGGADQVILPEGGRTFFSQVVFDDKEYREYPEARHELQDDVNYLEVMADLRDWMAQHLSPQLLNSASISTEV